MESPPPFELFGRTHLVTIAVTLALAVAVPLAARRLPDRGQRLVALAIIVALPIYRTQWIVHRILEHGDRWQQVLPLGICPILFYVCPIVLWRRGQGVYEVAYYWAIGGTLQALITPDVSRGFPDAEYVAFFASHGALILAVLYATFVFGMRPRWTSIPRVLVVTVAYAAVLIPLNALLGTNHMYVNGKPASASLLDHLGPWPWYNLTAIAAAMVFFSLSYAPFAIADRLRRPIAAPSAD